MTTPVVILFYVVLGFSACQAQSFKIDQRQLVEINEEYRFKSSESQSALTRQLCSRCNLRDLVIHSKETGIIGSIAYWQQFVHNMRKLSRPELGIAHALGVVDAKCDLGLPIWVSDIVCNGVKSIAQVDKDITFEATTERLPSIQIEDNDHIEVLFSKDMENAILRRVRLENDVWDTPVGKLPLKLGKASTFLRGKVLLVKSADSNIVVVCWRNHEILLQKYAVDDGSLVTRIYLSTVPCELKSSD